VLVAAAGGAGAQSTPPLPPPVAPMAPSAAAPPQSQNPVCRGLEAQLAAIDRGGNDQVRRYEDAVQGQQAELDRTVAQARRTGCEGSGFFLFARSQPPQCDELNGRIQRMRANLDRLNSDLQQLRMNSRGAAEAQRRQVLTSLAQNDCGPQYRAAAAPRQRGFFETLFGGGGNVTAPFGSGDVTPSDQSSTYRTICVRTCDGYYFPVSYSTGSAKFRDDEQACQRMCPASEVALYTYRNPGEDVSQAVSINGQPYTSLPNAFRYRQEFNPACSCRRPGESWAETLRNLEDTTVERGDIIVTDETAKALAQPKVDAAARTARQGTRAGKNDPKAQAAPAAAPATADAAAAEGSAKPAPVTAAPLPDATPAPPPAPAEAAAAAAEPGKRTIRAVGPPFIVR